MENIVLRCGELRVELDPVFPRILKYHMEDRCLHGDFQRNKALLINGKRFYPEVRIHDLTERSVCYCLQTSDTGFLMEICYSVTSECVKIETKKIREGDFPVTTVGFEDEILFSADSSQILPTLAVVSNRGKWKSITDEITEDLTSLDSGVTEHIYAMLSADGVAATLNSTSIRNKGRFLRTVVKKNGETIVGIGNQVFDYHMPDHTLRPLPKTVILLCGDRNHDGKVDWKDAAVGYRSIRTPVPGEDTVKNHLMWIAYNSCSQVQEPFYKTLDTGKAIFNLTDGFSQMVMHKGYQAEGHDDSHGDYGGNIGLRQGGKEALNRVIRLGKKYNILSGVHINVNEHMADARFFNPAVLKEPYERGWSFFDQAYFLDQRKDILTGNRRKNLRRMKENLPDLDFVYVDIYGIEDPDDWCSSNLIANLQEMGWMIGTEFSGPMEQAAAFTHWGHDMAYPNESNESRIMRYFKNDFDIFRADALMMGSYMLSVASWEQQCDMQEGTRTFYNHTLITKYLQHHPLLNYESDFALFEGNVRTRKLADRVLMTKNGHKLAEWQWELVNSGNLGNHTEEKTGKAVLFLPWFGENSKTNDPDDADKIYHWNAYGGKTTWDVPEGWTDGMKVSLYELTRNSKIKRKNLTVRNGKLTVEAKAEVPYVIYPRNQKPRTAGNFGEGSPIRNPGFDDRSLSMWNPIAKDCVIGTTYSSYSDPRLTMESESYGNGEISQTLKKLRCGTAYTVYLFADISEGAKLTVQVSCGGKTAGASACHCDYPCYNLAKYAGTCYQKVKVTFDVPDDENNAKLKIECQFGKSGGRVNVDDVRIWENMARSPRLTDPGMEDYVLYEDFENVEQGYGCFVSAGNAGSAGDFQVHLAEKASTQFLSYAINGKYSLKINQGGEKPQTLLRTHPNQFKLEANTRYEIGFSYMIGLEAKYAIRIKNDHGTTIYERQLEATYQGTEGEKQKSKTVIDCFETDNQTDYYLSVDLLEDKKIQSKETAAVRLMDIGALSLDDVFVRRFHAFRG